jgi:REP element-mobilizing transposase RayT
LNDQFGWQPRFHDHIIRNKTDYNRIENYIINNPKKWNEDRFRMK